MFSCTTGFDRAYFRGRSSSFRSAPTPIFMRPFLLFSILAAIVYPSIASCRVLDLPITESRSTASSPLSPSSSPAAPTVGWDCFIDRSFLCRACLGGRSRRICDGILLFGRRKMQRTRHFRDNLPLPSLDLDPLAVASSLSPRLRWARRAFGRAAASPECVGWVSVLLDDSACTFAPQPSRRALRAAALFAIAAQRPEPFAKAAGMKFGGFFAPKMDHVVWMPPDVGYRTLRPGKPSRPHLTAAAVNRIWRELWLKSFGRPCPPGRIITRRVRNTWHTTVRC